MREQFSDICMNICMNIFSDYVVCASDYVLCVVHVMTWEVVHAFSDFADIW